MIFILILSVLSLIIVVWRAAEFLLNALIDISTNQTRLAYDIQNLREKTIKEKRSVYIFRNREITPHQIAIAIAENSAEATDMVIEQYEYFQSGWTLEAACVIDNGLIHWGDNY